MENTCTQLAGFAESTIILNIVPYNTTVFTPDRLLYTQMRGGTLFLRLQISGSMRNTGLPITINIVCIVCSIRDSQAADPAYISDPISAATGIHAVIGALHGMMRDFENQLSKNRFAQPRTESIFGYIFVGFVIEDKNTLNHSTHPISVRVTSI